MKKQKPVYLISFLLPLLLMLVVFAGNQIFPFGKDCFLRTDLYHQYAPFMTEFMEKIKHGGSLLYSWNIGLGSNFLALYGYYLASPLNWLAILFPQGLVIEFLSYMVVLKVALSSLTFSYYLSKKYDTEDPCIAFFALFYAFSAYFAAYSWNVMWMDCLVLAPLILLGLERLVKEGKCLFYIVTLAVCILTNYYISIMICIFLTIYFLALLAMERDHGKHIPAFVRFAGSSLLAGALGMVLILPVFAALGMTASSDFSFPKTLTSYFSVFAMLARHMVNVDCETGLDHWPNIYCGVAVFLFAPLYMMNRRISVREKIVKGALLLFMLLGFSLNIPNYIWHGFHFPNSLPARQSFLYILLLLTMCYEAFKHRDSISGRQFAGAFFGSVGFLLLCEVLLKEDWVDFKAIYVTLLFLGLYALLLLAMYKKKEKMGLLFLFTIVLISVEASMNMAVTSIHTVNRANYLSHQGSYKVLSDYIEKEDPSLYRIENLNRNTKNDAALASYRSASVFSSTANASVTKLFEALGMEGSTNAYSYTGATPFASALLGVKYVYSSEDPGSIYSFVEQDGSVGLYRCDYTLPIGFMMPGDITSRWNYVKSTPAQFTNGLASALTGCGPILVESNDGVASLGTYTLDISVSGYYYVYVTNRTIEDVTIEKDGLTRDISNVKRGFFVSLGFCEAGKTVVLTTEQGSETFNANAYRLDEAELRDALAKLSDEPFETTAFTDTKVEGTITAKEEGLLYFSIPFEHGWNVLVDGELAEKETFADTMLAVHVPAGTHEITLTYSPSGFQVGLLVSVLSLLLSLLVYVLYLRKHMNTLFPIDEEEDEEEAAEEAKAPAAEAETTIETTETQESEE